MNDVAVLELQTFPVDIARHLRNMFAGDFASRLQNLSIILQGFFIRDRSHFEAGILCILEFGSVGKTVFVHRNNLVPVDNFMELLLQVGVIAEIVAVNHAAMPRRAPAVKSPISRGPQIASKKDCNPDGIRLTCPIVEFRRGNVSNL